MRESEGPTEHGVVRWAVVGAGRIAQDAVLPAFRNARHAELVAIVSGDDAKRDALARQYGVRAVGYDGYDALCASGEVDAVYVALPNHLHCEYTVRAARHGVHVLCEKPMAVTEEDCERMRHACEAGGAKLMIAYRLHLDPANVESVRLARDRLGELRWFSAVFSEPVEPGNIRTNDVSMGGGALYDIGIYCINAARAVFGDEPEEVFATATMATDPVNGGTYDRTVGATLRFPGGRVATVLTGFDTEKVGAYRVAGTRGELRMDPAFGYAEPRIRHLTIGGRTRSERFPVRNQFAPLLATFSQCILQDRPPEPDAREGRADVRILRALHRSAQEGRPVRIRPAPSPNRPDPDPAIHRPPVEPPEEV